MEKLKKLFPLSFKWCKSVKGLVLSGFILTLLYMAFYYCFKLIAEPIISSVLGFFLWPLYVVTFIIGFVLYYIAIILCCFIVTIPLAVPLIFIASVLIALFAFIPALITSIASTMFYMYCIASFVIAVLAYAGVFGKTDAAEEVVVEEAALEIEAAPEE